MQNVDIYSSIELLTANCSASSLVVAYY